MGVRKLEIWELKCLNRLYYLTKRFTMTESECVAELMKMYEKLVNGDER